MLAAKVLKKFAEKARRALLEEGALANGFKPSAGTKYVFFPVTKRIGLNGVDYVEKDFAEKKQALDLKSELRKALGEKADKANKAFDLIGDVAVIQVPRELDKEKKLVAKPLLRSNKRIKTVLEKTGGRKGVFRVQQVKWLVGEKRFRALHKENGCFFKIDLRKAFFSPRLGAERLRIAGLVKKDEIVLVPFSGVGPFAIVIARKSRAKKIVAVELNKDAYALLEENVSLNKACGKVVAVKGDAAKELGKLLGDADRVVMPLPHSAFKFLPLVFDKARKGCVIHLYAFCEAGGEKKLFEKAAEAAVDKGRRIKLLYSRKVTDYAPGVAELVLDLKMV